MSKFKGIKKLDEFIENQKAAKEERIAEENARAEAMRIAEAKSKAEAEAREKVRIEAERKTAVEKQPFFVHKKFSNKF